MPQLMQTSVHALSQQTYPTQKPLAHSVAAAHEAPFNFDAGGVGALPPAPVELPPAPVELPPAPPPPAAPAPPPASAPGPPPGSSRALRAHTRETTPDRVTAPAQTKTTRARIAAGVHDASAAARCQSCPGAVRADRMPARRGRTSGEFGGARCARSVVEIA